MSDNPYNEKNLSVSAAKSYIASIDMNGIAGQIQHYQTTATTLNTLAQQVAAINTKLQSTWSGAAADAANIQFGTAANNASNMASLLSDRVVPALQNVHAAGQQAKTKIASVQNEVTVSAYTSSSSKEAAAADAQEMSTISQQQSFNTAQRQKAADAMNTVANTYNSTATTLAGLATSGFEAAPTPTSSPSGSFNLGSIGSGSGSNGAASSYRSTVGIGGKNASAKVVTGATTIVDEGGTSVQGYVPPTSSTSPPALPPASASSVMTAPPPVTGIPVGSLPIGSAPVGADPVSNGTPSVSDPLPAEPVTGFGSTTAPGVFGEGGLSSGTGSGVVSTRTSFGGAVTDDGIESGVIGGNAASTPSEGASGEQPGMAFGMGGGMQGGGASGGENLGRSTYSRSRYLGQEHSNYAPQSWENPAVGGEEGVLIGQRPVGSSGVRSVFEGAQDAQGNPLGMMGGGTYAARDTDENDESGSRPGYLKEDPQWWQPEGKHVPSVVE